MMRILVCTVDVDPCPASQQSWKTTEEVADPAAFGMTPEAAAKAFAFGFGAVFSFFLIGYVLALAVGLVKKA